LTKDETKKDLHQRLKNIDLGPHPSQTRLHKLRKLGNSPGRQSGLRGLGSANDKKWGASKNQKTQNCRPPLPEKNGKPEIKIQKINYNEDRNFVNLVK